MRIAALLLVISFHASASPLDELQQVMADAAREMKSHHARLQGLATEAEYRVEFLEFNARLDALQLHFVDAHLRAKSRLSAEEWDAMPRLLQSDDATTQELFGFLQTYDATAGDLAPILQRLRQETSARQEQIIRDKFPPP